MRGVPSVVGECVLTSCLDVGRGLGCWGLDGWND